MEYGIYTISFLSPTSKEKWSNLVTVFSDALKSHNKHLYPNANKRASEGVHCCYSSVERERGGAVSTFALSTCSLSLGYFQSVVASGSRNKTGLSIPLCQLMCSPSSSFAQEQCLLCLHISNTWTNRLMRGVEMLSENAKEQSSCEQKLLFTKVSVLGAGQQFGKFPDSMWLDKALCWVQSQGLSFPCGQPILEYTISSLGKLINDKARESLSCSLHKCNARGKKISEKNSDEAVRLKAQVPNHGNQ